MTKRWQTGGMGLDFFGTPEFEDQHRLMRVGGEVEFAQYTGLMKPPGSGSFGLQDLFRDCSSITPGTSFSRTRIRMPQHIRRHPTASTALQYYNRNAAGDVSRRAELQLMPGRRRTLAQTVRRKDVAIGWMPKCMLLRSTT